MIALGEGGGGRSGLNFSIVPLEFLLWATRVAFPGKSQLRQSRATQLRVHAGCFGVSIIN